MDLFLESAQGFLQAFAIEGGRELQQNHRPLNDSVQEGAVASIYICLLVTAKAPITQTPGRIPTVDPP